VNKTEEGKYCMFITVLKHLSINIPLIEALEQMPNYTKFMKDVLSKKKKLGQYDMISLTEKCNAVLDAHFPC